MWQSTDPRQLIVGQQMTGLGPDGNLGAQVFQAAGYRVTAVEPSAERRALAAKCGIRDVQASVPATATFHLALECSGLEWLRGGKLNGDGLAEPASPENLQAIYEALHAGKGAPTRVVDWGTI